MGPRSHAGLAYRTILVPYDFSEHARAAFDVALDLAARLGARVHVLHVVQTPVYTTAGMYGVPVVPPPSARQEVLDALRALESAAGRPVVPHVVEATSVVAPILRAAEDLSSDLIVMGTLGRTRLAQALLGSVVERTLRRAPCPVLVVRASREETDRRPSSPSHGPAPASVALETLSAAMDRLSRAGFRESLKARAGRLVACNSGRAYAPEDLVVREIVRFEGESDPADSAVLFALRSHDGRMFGTFVASYGPAAEPETCSVVRGLEARHSPMTRSREHSPRATCQLV